jgi:hypothetical protein
MIDSHPLIFSIILRTTRKRKLSDDDDDDDGGDLRAESKSHKLIQPTIAWHVPLLLPERHDAPPPQNNST